MIFVIMQDSVDINPLSERSINVDGLCEDNKYYLSLLSKSTNLFASAS